MLELQRDMEIINRRAEDIGMKINKKKTQLLVMSPPNGCDTSASIVVEGQTVEAIDALKLVGFTFGMAPGAGEHYKVLRSKFRRKVWMLYNLRRAGFKGRQLYRLNCCYLWSIIKYCSAVYHALLNKGQEEALEKLHRHAIRICYGFEVPVSKVMVREDIETLKQRRIRRCDAFIRKGMKSGRFSAKWFPPRITAGRALRNSRHILEQGLCSLPRFNSPLAFMRRRANELSLCPGGMGQSWKWEVTEHGVYEKAEAHDYEYEERWRSLILLLYT